MCVCTCVCACVRACVRACVCVCVRVQCTCICVIEVTPIQFCMHCGTVTLLQFINVLCYYLSYIVLVRVQLVIHC